MWEAHCWVLFSASQCYKAHFDLWEHTGYLRHSCLSNFWGRVSLAKNDQGGLFCFLTVLLQEGRVCVHVCVYVRICRVTTFIYFVDNLSDRDRWPNIISELWLRSCSLPHKTEIRTMVQSATAGEGSPLVPVDSDQHSTCRLRIKCISIFNIFPAKLRMFIPIRLNFKANHENIVWITQST